MSDNLTREQRHKNMTHIRSKNTKPEMIVRKYLFSKGLRYRLHVAALPGKPDLVFPKYHTVVFVQGCFWHQHPGCKYAAKPAVNQDYWLQKLARNVQRDLNEKETLEKIGWKVIFVWECELKSKKQEEALKELYLSIIS